MDGLNSFEMTPPKYIPLEIIQSEQQKKMNGVSATCRTITKDLTFVSSEFWKEKTKRARLKKHLKK